MGRVHGVTQEVQYAEDVRGKVRSLERAIKEKLPAGQLAVVFVETKRSADTLELDLHEKGVAVACIHGDRSQQERMEALQAFKSGDCPVLVATDVAARGLDIPYVALVVNFDMPKQIDDYVHRIGRTGRAGRKGTAIAFVNERCMYLKELRDLLIEAKQDPPIWYDELCSQAGGRGRPGPKRPDVGGPKLGGRDIRDTESISKPAAQSRDPNAWGQTGADDAW